MQRRERLWFPGRQIIELKQDGTVTGGAFLLLEVITEPGGGAPQPHLHTREDETLLLLEGRVEVTIGDERRSVEPGDVVFFPRGVPHSFHNPGPATSRGIGVVAPSGLETFFRMLGTPMEDVPPAHAVEPTAAEWAAAASRVGMRLLEPQPS